MSQKHPLFAFACLPKKLINHRLMVVILLKIRQIFFYLSAILDPPFWTFEYDFRFAINDFHEETKWVTIWNDVLLIEKGLCNILCSFRFWEILGWFVKIHSILQHNESKMWTSSFSYEYTWQYITNIFHAEFWSQLLGLGTLYVVIYILCMSREIEFCLKDIVIVYYNFTKKCRSGVPDWYSDWRWLEDIPKLQVV